MSRERSLVKNTFFISLGTILPRFTSVVTLPIITAYLTKVEFGTVDLLSTLIALVLPIATLKIEAAAFRFLIDCRQSEEKTKEVISTIQFFLILIACPVMVVIFLCLHALPVTTRILICLYFGVDIIHSSFVQIVRGLSKYLLYSVSLITNAVINMVLTILLIYKARQGLNGYVAAMVGASLASMSLMLVGARIFHFLSVKAFSVNLLKQMLQYSWPMTPNALSLWVMNLSDRVLINLFWGIEANAVYAAANKIPKLFAAFQGIFVTAWQENASLAVTDDDADDYYSKIFDVVYSLLVGIMACLIAVTPVLFKLLIRGDYQEAYYQMPFLFGGIMFSALSTFFGGIYIAHKRTKSVGVTTTIAAVLNFLINIALINRIGLYAASLSTFISYAFLALYRMYDVQKFQKLYLNMKKTLVAFALLVVMGIFMFINTNVLNCINFVFGVIFAFVLNRNMITVWISIIKKKLKV